jgi:hypothetical protein
MTWVNVLNTLLQQLERHLEHTVATMGTEIIVSSQWLRITLSHKWLWILLLPSINGSVFIPFKQEWYKSTIPLSRSYERSNLLTSPPVIWREKHLWNYSVLQRVHLYTLVHLFIYLFVHACIHFLSIHLFMSIYLHIYSFIYCSFVHSFIHMCPYLFIFGLLNDAVSSSDYISSKDHLGLIYTVCNIWQVRVFTLCQHVEYTWFCSHRICPKFSYFIMFLFLIRSIQVQLPCSLNFISAAVIPVFTYAAFVVFSLCLATLFFLLAWVLLF